MKMKMKTELKELQLKEEEIYKKINAFTKDFTEEKKKRYWKVLSELINNQIEIEKFCNN